MNINIESKPLVSIICITMNHEKFVEQSFRSVVEQTYKNIEILYVDNNSHDASFEIADNIFKQSGLPYIGSKREKNYGVCANVNFLLQQAKGKYITFQSGDDWWALNNLEERIKYLEQHPEYGMLYANYYFHYYDTNLTVLNTDTSHHLSGWVFKDLLGKNFISAIGAVYRKDVLDDVGLYDENSLVEDWDMSLRIAEKYQIGYQSTALVYYGRQKSSNISANFLYMEKAYHYIFQKYAGYPEIKEARKRFELYKAYYYASNEPSFKTLLFLLKSFQFNFTYFKQVTKCLIGMVTFKGKTDTV